MWSWLKELYEIRSDYRERSERCESCEVLKHQLNVLSIENHKLIDRILEKPTTTPVNEPPQMISKPSFVPWNVRKQMLEREDREKARIMRSIPQPDVADITELEKELGIIEKMREQGLK